LSAYADAGYVSHTDGRSQTGLVFCIGGSPFFFKSTKQQRVVLSSTEAEFEALTEGCKYLEWLRHLMEELHLRHKGPIDVYQDNRSTITLATGPGTFKRSKHALVRHAYVRELVKNGQINIVWVKSEDMIADILTKIMVGDKYQQCRKSIGMVPAENDA
jgi:hypothetical protein